MGESTADRNPVELLAEEFAARLRRGEHPSLTEYVERYPEHADDIRELFPALALVEQFKPVRQERDGSLAESVPAVRGNLPAQLGDYRILRYLGEGGMGVVYEAVRESLRCHVALKVMHPQYRNRPSYLRRFHIEARSAARLHHTNIVSVFDYGEHDGVCYYAMQYIAGQSLDKVLDDIRQLRLEKEEGRNGDADTQAFAVDSRGEHDAVGEVDRARRTSRSLRQTITFGLLTGQFATPGALDSPGEQDSLPRSEMSTATPAEAADLGAATRRFVSELRHAEAEMRAAEDPLPTLGNADDPEKNSAHDTTSSLTGKSDVRYYREVARLGAQVADALAYAHQRGVLHRDIKPPNLILDPLGNIWVTDFGLAKFEEGDDLSQSHDLVGTLRYMAPERFRGVSDRRGDLYALGATLYELLTLRPVFEGKDQLDLIHRIENDPPIPPRQLDRRIHRDLETIVLKAVAKDPNHRFASAEELAAELRLFVDNRPIHSRPIPYYQQFWRWCKRNPALAATNIAAAALTTILAIVSTFAALSYRAQRNALRIERGKTQGALQAQADAERETQLRKLDGFHSKRNGALAKRFSRQVGQRFESLKALTQAAEIGRELKLPIDLLDPLRDEAIACMTLPDLRLSGRVITKPAGVIRTAFDSTMTRYALRFRDGAIQVRRVADDQQIARFQARGDREIFVFGFSPDGRYLATTQFPDRALTVWDIERVTVVLNDPGPVSGVAAKFSPDSRWIGVGHDDGELVVYDLATGQANRRCRVPAPPRDLVFRSDGIQIAIAYDEQARSACRILETESGRLVRSIALPTTGGGGLAWSPDGATLATPCDDSRIYVWQAATGARKATLEGQMTGGLVASFDASGALLACNDWAGQLRIWDPVLGRPWLKLTGYGHEFSRDGKIVVTTEDDLTTYEVYPGLEYRTLAYPASPPLNYARVSIHRGGRLLAVGTNGGVVVWDLVHARELDFMPIGLAWHTTFEPSGDLLTSGAFGVWRWPVEVSTDRNEYHIGPPQQLPLPGSGSGIDHDRSGQIVALANNSESYVVTPDRRFQVGPLDDCRGVAVSPDGEWLATAMRVSGGVQVWRIRDGMKVKELAIDHDTGVLFSPDGKWLMTQNSPCRLWSVGTWEAARQIGGVGHCFSPEGRQLLVQEADATVRLVETETGRTLARFDSPDLCVVGFATFSPDGTRLVVSTKDGPAVHVWDLRAIRKHLAEMGPDWDAPAYPDDDSDDRSALALRPLHVDYGKLKGHIDQANDPEKRIQASTARLKKNPDDDDAYHQRGHALVQLNRLSEGIDDFTRAIHLRPDDVHLRVARGIIYEVLKRYDAAISDLETALARQSDQPVVRERLALLCNNRAWELANGPEPRHGLERALELSQRAVALAPGQRASLNTLGVVQYRTGRFAEAITSLERSLTAGKGQSDAFDFFFLAMAHQRLGHCPEARACYDRAVGWLRERNGLSEKDAKELTAFRAEAEAVLAGPSDELPGNVFAPD